jgi:excisionase family DNA binding protein
MTRESDDRFTLSVAEVAEIFRVSEASIYVQVHNSTFPVRALRLGRTIRFSRKAVERFLEGEEVSA